MDVGAGSRTWRDVDEVAKTFRRFVFIRLFALTGTTGDGVDDDGTCDNELATAAAEDAGAECPAVAADKASFFFRLISSWNLAMISFMGVCLKRALLPKAAFDLVPCCLGAGAGNGVTGCGAGATGAGAATGTGLGRRRMSATCGKLFTTGALVGDTGAG